MAFSAGWLPPRLVQLKLLSECCLAVAWVDIRNSGHAKLRLSCHFWWQFCVARTLSLAEWRRVCTAPALPSMAKMSSPHSTPLHCTVCASCFLFLALELEVMLKTKFVNGNKDGAIHIVIFFKVFGASRIVTT